MEITATHGVSSEYPGGAPSEPRHRGHPYQRTNEENCVRIAEKLRKDGDALRMLVCAAESVDEHTPIEATPTASVEKRNPDRAISLDRRVVDDLRRVNLHFPTTQYYPAHVPTAPDISRLVLTLRTRSPGVKTRLTKRAVSAAFRLLRLRPSLSLLMGAEPPHVVSAKYNRPMSCSSTWRCRLAGTAHERTLRRSAMQSHRPAVRTE